MTYLFDGSTSPLRRVASVEFVAPYGPLAHVDVTYHREWLSEGYPFGPDLPLRSGALSSREVPGALLDAGPDSWGRAVLADALNAQGRGGELVHDGDYVLHAPDATRQGSLRFSPHPEGGDWMGHFEEGDPLPGLVDTERLLEAIENYEDREATAGDLRLLLHAASSPGGARPKANISRDGSLAIVKFPSALDRWDVISLEALTLGLARRAGIEVPMFEHRRIRDDRSILILNRFDRGRDGLRSGYISAMTLLGRHSVHDVDDATYVQQVRRQAAFVGDPLESGRELFRRLIFTIALNNVDDHLRNYGYLHRHGSWTLSPAFDINPWPLALGGRPVVEGERSLGSAIESAAHFALDKDSARETARSVLAAVAAWGDLAERFGISGREVSVMEDALAIKEAEAREVMTSRVFVQKPEPVSTPRGEIWIEGYYRNGTWVQGHWRRSSREP